MNYLTLPGEIPGLLQPGCRIRAAFTKWLDTDGTSDEVAEEPQKFDGILLSYKEGRWYAFFQDAATGGYVADNGTIELVLDAAGCDRAARWLVETSNMEGGMLAPYWRERELMHTLWTLNGQHLLFLFGHASQKLDLDPSSQWNERIFLIKETPINSVDALRLAVLHMHQIGDANKKDEPCNRT